MDLPSLQAEDDFQVPDMDAIMSTSGENRIRIVSFSDQIQPKYWDTSLRDYSSNDALLKYEKIGGSNSGGAILKIDEETK